MNNGFTMKSVGSSGGSESIHDDFELSMIRNDIQHFNDLHNKALNMIHELNENCISYDVKKYMLKKQYKKRENELIEARLKETGK
jgi:hypothetical protein